MQARQRIERDHVAQYFHGIVLDDADVLQARLLDAFQKPAHAGIEHFHAQEIVAGARQRDFLGGLAHAEADFQHGGRAAPKSQGEIKRPGRSEEHTSELQSLMRISYAVFCLKKKKLMQLTTKAKYIKSL